MKAPVSGRSSGGNLNGNLGKLALKERIHQIQNLTRLSSFVDFNAQLRSVPYAVCEIRSELFHLAHRIHGAALAQHRVIRSHDVVALTLGGVLVTSGREILRDLPKNPRIRGSRAA